MSPADPRTTIPDLPNRPNGTVITQALNAAHRRYPGPVGKVLCQEIEVWREFGHLLGGHALMRELVEFLTGAELMSPGVVHRSEVE